MMRKFFIFQILIVFCYTNTITTISNTKFLNEAEFNFLARVINNFGTNNEIITYDKIKQALKETTGQVLLNTTTDLESWLLLNEQSYWFNLIMPSLLPQITVQLSNQSETTYNQILLQLHEHAINFIFNDEYQRKIMLNVHQFQKGNNEFKIACDNQICRVASFFFHKPIIYNFLTITCNDINNDAATQLYFQKAYCADTNIVIQVKKIIAERLIAHIFQNFSTIATRLDFKIINPLSYQDLFDAYADSAGYWYRDYANIVPSIFQSWITDAFDQKYRKEYIQITMSENEKKEISNFFNTLEEVTYENIQKKLFRNTKDHQNIGKILQLSQSRQDEVVDKIKSLVSQKNNRFQNYAELKKFVQKYSCQKDLIEDSNFIDKGSNITRLINAKRLAECMKQNHWHNLNVANKCLQKEGDFLIVYAQKIQGAGLHSLSLQETQDLIDCTLKTGYQDWGSLNNAIREIDSNQITFVDTEDKSFIAQNCSTVLQLLEMLYKKLFSIMNHDAQQWFLQYLHQIQQDPAQSNLEITPLSRNTNYDPIEIDFEQVKQEYKAWQANLSTSTS